VSILRRLLRREPPALDEGLLLADRAAVLEIRNRIEVATLGHADREFDPVDFRADAREALATLETEQRDVASRLDAERRSVRARYGSANSHHDYRRADRRNLGLRARAARMLADALAARAADPEYLDRLVERARQDAWRDVAGQLKRHLDAAAAPPVRPDEARIERLSDLAADLIAEVDAHEDPLD